MHLELSVSIVTPQITLLINALFHAMKQRSQRPKKCVPSLLAKNMALVVVVVDGALVMVMVDMGVTKIILGVSGVLPKVPLPLPVQIHLRVMESRRRTESG
jgi:hypothetical protein